MSTGRDLPVPNEKQIDAARDILRLCGDIVVKQFSDSSGVDLRDEITSLQDVLSRCGVDLEPHIEYAADTCIEADPHARLVYLWDLVEAMLYNMVEADSDHEIRKIDAIVHYLRHGDFNALLQDEELMEALEIAIGAHDRETRDIEQFYHFVQFMRRMQRAMDVGPVPPGGTFDAILVESEEDDEDETFELGDPIF